MTRIRGEEAMQIVLQKLQDTFFSTKLKPQEYFVDSKEQIIRAKQISRNIENDFERFKELVDKVNDAIKRHSLKLTWDKIGDVVVVKVINSVTGEELKVFPPEQVAKYINWLSTFIEVWLSLFVDRKV